MKPSPLFAVLAATMLAAPARAQDHGAVVLGQAVAGLGTNTRVLVIGAHPDDEDSRLIAWLARGRHVATAYLSLTRGDGGQNLIGNELGEPLGVIRTEELLAARRVDGATQYFTRAYDFGFSKSAGETFTHWQRDSILGDVVRVVRSFRPHVIVAIFSGTPADGHGHHQVSGILAREAFDAALDTVRFPPRSFGPAWTPLKFFRNSSYRGNVGATFFYNAGEYAPLLGRSFAEIAGLSRSQHKSQGFGQLQRKGPSIGSLQLEASRVTDVAHAAQERTIFDGIDTTWKRLAPDVRCGAARAALDSLAPAIAAAQHGLDLFDPSTDVDPLLRVRRLGRTALAGTGPGCEARPGDATATLTTLLTRTDDALVEALGVAVEANVDRDVLALGDSLPAAVTVYDRGHAPLDIAVAVDAAPAVHESPMAADGMASDGQRDRDLRILPDSAARTTVEVPGVMSTEPWWLERPRHDDVLMAQTTVPVKSAEAMSPYPEVAVTIRRDGEAIPLRVPVERRYADAIRGEISRPLSVVPAVSITLDRDVAYARANATIALPVRVTLRSAKATPDTVSVALSLPAGLRSDSATRTAILADEHEERTVEFIVRGRLAPGRQRITATATSDGRSFARGYVPIEYDHIRPQKLFRDATLDVEAVDLAVPAGLNVAYIQGVGDNVAPMLKELGIPVTMIDPAALATTDLSTFTTVVVGTRAYEAQPDLVAGNSRLFDYARRGGTVVVQYGQYEMTRPGMMPYPITLARPAQRVTDENAKVAVLDSGSALLAVPNRITSRDFSGWVQDMTLYMPATHDPRYAAPLSVHDPGEAPNDGAILIAPLGNGRYIYTTLAFFRQLPAGNPGAARLFVNLLSSGTKRGPMSLGPQTLWRIGG